MFTNVQFYTHSEKETNEDAYGITDTAIFVLDGATGLSKKEYMHPQSDAFWLVKEIQTALLNHWDPCDSPITILKETQKQLSLRYHQVADQQISSAEMPSACIAMFYEHQDEIHFFGMGDCYGIIELTNGETKIFSDPVLEKLDHAALEQMKKVSNEKQIPFLEARKYIQQQLLDNRMMRNKPNGYHALDLEWSNFEEIPIHRWKKKDVKRLLCASDGFYEIMHYNIIQDPKELLDHLSTHSEELIQQLFHAQEADAQAILCPRFKLRDDCTFVYVEVNL